jgi:hypothetical protein
MLFLFCEKSPRLTIYAARRGYGHAALPSDLGGARMPAPKLRFFEKDLQITIFNQVDKFSYGRQRPSHCQEGAEHNESGQPRRDALRDAKMPSVDSRR